MFKPYDVVPTFDSADPNVRLVDLTGDGSSDALMTPDQHFLWFECLGEQGFAAPKRIPRRHDLDTFPDVFFNDPGGTSPPGRHDWGRPERHRPGHNGRIEYWPNLGYGRFGTRSPWRMRRGCTVNFDPKRLFLADLNGTGCADLVYVDFGRVHFWFNQSGNRWSEKQTDSRQGRHGSATSTPSVRRRLRNWHRHPAVELRLCWQPRRPYKALDFCGGSNPTCSPK